MITSLGEERAGLYASRALVCLFCTRQFLSFFSVSWCQGLAAACDCGTLWTFLFLAFQCDLAVEYSSCFISVLNCDLYVLLAVLMH